MIYFDYSATTPVDKKVLNKMTPFFSKNYGNASSIYLLGQKSLFAIDEARSQVADFLGSKPEEIVFTASATESDNIAILGLIKKLKKERKNIHLITTKIEHPAILEPCRELEKEGVSVTYLSVGKDGIVDLSDIEKAIKKETALISIMYANSEMGAIQPIVKIGKMIEKINSKRSSKERIFFHTDAVQAVNYLDCKVDDLGVDMLSISGHKIYGPKGIGALYVKRGTPLQPVIYGGKQEWTLRSGTENVPGIVGLGEAIRQVSLNKKKNKKIEALRDKIIQGVLKNIPESRLNGSESKRLPNNINFSFRGAEGESIVMTLDQKGIFASTGSACSSKNLSPSHVLLAIGLSREEAHCSLRITLGKYTNEKEVDKLLKILPDIVRKLRKISGRL